FIHLPAFYSSSSFLIYSSSSFLSSPEISGKSGLMSFRTLIITSVIICLVCHSSSAGKMYHGLCSVDVWFSMPSKACWYLPHLLRSSISENENSHCLSGFFMRFKKRSFCSSFDILKKNFTTEKPFSDKYCS